MSGLKEMIQDSTSTESTDSQQTATPDINQESIVDSVIVKAIIEKRNLVWKKYRTRTSEGIGLNGAYSEGRVKSKDTFETKSHLIKKYDQGINRQIAIELTGYKNAALEAKGELDTKVALFYQAEEKVKTILKRHHKSGTKIDEETIHSINDTISQFNIGEVYKVRIQLNTTLSEPMANYYYSERTHKYHHTCVIVTRYFNTFEEAEEYSKSFMMQNAIKPESTVIEHVILYSKSSKSIPKIVPSKQTSTPNSIPVEKLEELERLASTKFGSQ